MKFKFCILFIIAVVVRSSATNYYLSSKGNDSQSGTSALTPWRSLQRLSEVTRLLPGDSVFFERESVFAGTLRISTSGEKDKRIFFGAFGSGAKPIISGSITVTHWTLFRGDIWLAESVAEPGDLFIDGRYQTLGRYPNEGYLTFSCNSQCQKTLADKNLTFADGYWDESEVVVKSSRWTLDNLPVSNYFDKTFYFSVAASYPLPNGFGYFIQKHLATLDRPGEWFYDKASRKIFLYCARGDSPDRHKIEVSTTDAGLEITNANFVTIENLVFKYQRMSGAKIKNSSYAVMRNCVIDYSGNNGLELISCLNPVVENCTIKNSSNNGVEWSSNTNGSFINNSIQRVGLHPGRGASGNGTYIGLNITTSHTTSDKNLFQYNTVDSIGYLGIDFRTGGTTIKNNLITNFCMIKDDGAGIYTWGNSHGDNRIEENIVLHGSGCGAGTNDPNRLWASGIYIDDRSSDVTVIGNTVAYCSASGIYLHNAKRISLRGNRVFENANNSMNNDNGQLCIKLDALVVMEDKALDLRVTENLLATTQEENHCVYLSAEREKDLAALGSFDQNRYLAPHADQVIAKFYSKQSGCNALEELNLPEWQRCVGNDKNSNFKMLPTAARPTGINLIKNGQMTNDIGGWMVWPSQVVIVHDKKKGTDGPSLRVQFHSGGNEALVYHAGFGLRSDKPYRLSFSAKSAVKNKIEFAPLMAKAPWEALAASTCFSVDTVFKSYTYLFKPNKESSEARVNFKANATFWIDNVTLYEVNSTGETDQRLRLIYNATEKPKTVSFSEKLNDLDGNPISNPLLMPGYSSLVLRRADK